MGLESESLECEFTCLWFPCSLTCNYCFCIRQIYKVSVSKVVFVISLSSNIRNMSFEIYTFGNKIKRSEKLL